MIKVYKERRSCKPSSASDAYVLKILPVAGNGITAITSANELLVVDGTALASGAVLRMDSPGRGLTCLISDDAGQNVFCGGEDGVVSIFDVRSQQRTGKLQISQSYHAQIIAVQDFTSTDHFYRQADHFFSLSRKRCGCWDGAAASTGRFARLVSLLDRALTRIARPALRSHHKIMNRALCRRTRDAART